MTNDLDTESRLRNYLHARAGSYPDSAKEPGLPTERVVRRRAWPALVAAAAITAAMVLAIPIFRFFDQDDSAAGDTQDALAVPYILTAGRSTTLHDGDVTVQLRFAIAHTSVLGRVEGGWLIHSLALPANGMQVGTVHRSGRFTPIGSNQARGGSALSPDHTQVAIADRARLRVFDVASGKELRSISARPSTHIAGWNRDGIWFNEGSITNPVHTYVWRPDAARASRVLDAAGDGFLAVSNSTDSIILGTRKGDRWCMQVATVTVALPASVRFKSLREHCGTGRQRYPVLSSDGRFMIVPEDKVAIEVDTGEVTRLEGMPDIFRPQNAYAESSTSFLVVTDRSSMKPGATPPAGTAGPRLPDPSTIAQVVSRCRTTTSACTPIYRTPAGTRIRLGMP